MAVGKGSILRASNANSKAEEKTKSVTVTGSKSPVKQGTPAVVNATSEVSLKNLRLLEDMEPVTRHQQKKLEASIQKYGVLEPLTIWAKSQSVFFIVDGEKRFQAAKSLKLAKIPVFFAEAEDEKQALLLRQELKSFERMPWENARRQMTDGIHSEIPVHLL